MVTTSTPFPNGLPINSEWVADQPNEAPREVGGFAARRCERYAQRKKAHDGVENASDHIAQALE